MMKSLLDHKDRFPVKKYDSKKRTIDLEEISETEEIAVKFARTLDEQFNKLAARQENEAKKNFIQNLEFQIKGTTEFYSAGETKDFIIERSGKKLTVLETPLYSFYDRDEFENYEEFCDLIRAKYWIDAIPSEEEFEKAYVFYATGNKVYINNIPEYIERK